MEVIVLTGYPTLESAIDALRLGAFDYIIKPVLDLDLVSEKIRRALERRHLRAQNRALAGQLADALDSLEDALGKATEALRDQRLEELKLHIDAASRATKKARSAQPGQRTSEIQ
jgi:DNA-binding NtrC family response regulator